MRDLQALWWEFLKQKCGLSAWNEKIILEALKLNMLGKTLLLGKIEGRRRRGWQTMRWLDGITDLMDMSLSITPGAGNGQGRLACCTPWGREESDMTERLNWTKHSLKWRTFLMSQLTVHEKIIFQNIWHSQTENVDWSLRILPLWMHLVTYKRKLS